MNYYKHHLGDYAVATAHLSWDEDMAYSRLIRVYYQHEKPIPAELRDACRLARATTPAQRKAVETVLREFFELLDDGWHQKRCDEELSRAQRQAEANRETGRLGGRPRKETGSVSETEPNGNRIGFDLEPNDNPSHKPLANSHTPTPRLLGVGFAEFWLVYPRKEAKADALKAWKAKRLDDRVAEIVADVKRRVLEHRPWLDGFTPHPATYLRGERWNDAIDTRPGKAGQGLPPAATAPTHGRREL